MSVQHLNLAHFYLTDGASCRLEKVVPILIQLGLLPSEEPGRTSEEGVFSRLFEVETPAKVEAFRQALTEDPAS